MKIFDISWPLSEKTTGYKDRKTVTFETYKTFQVDNFRQSRITLDAHSGTHVDAPSHFLDDGKAIDAVPLERLVGGALVLDLSHEPEAITREVLQKYDAVILPQHIILLKTTNSSTKADDPFIANFVYLEASGAEYLRQKGVQAVGIDYLGIERNQPDHGTHTKLMQDGIVIVEGLRLFDVQEGEYFFCCLPLALQGLEAAPARAILIQ